MPITTPSAGSAGPDTREMVVIHKALRREFRLMPGVVDAAGSDPARVTRAGDHLDLMLTFLHHHHAGEDAILWPALLERDAPDAGLVAVMQTQHGQVATATTSVRTLAAAWRSGPTDSTRGALCAALGDLDAALQEHLDVEEDSVLPLVKRFVTREEWDALAQDGRDHLPAGRSAQLRQLGTILEDATEPESRWFLSELPLPARVAWRLIGRRSYRRHCSLLRGTTTGSAA